MVQVNIFYWILVHLNISMDGFFLCCWKGLSTRWEELMGSNYTLDIYDPAFLIFPLHKRCMPWCSYIFKFHFGSFGSGMAVRSQDTAGKVTVKVECQTQEMKTATVKGFRLRTAKWQWYLVFAKFLEVAFAQSFLYQTPSRTSLGEKCLNLCCSKSNINQTSAYVYGI